MKQTVQKVMGQVYFPNYVTYLKNFSETVSKDLFNTGISYK